MAERARPAGADEDGPPTVVLPGGSLGVITPTVRARPRYIPPAAESPDETPIYPGVDDEDADDQDADDAPVAPAPPRAGAPAGTALALLLLRLAVGALLGVRGAQQLWGLLGGDGGAPLAGQLARLGYRSTETLATAVSVTELVVGALLVAGLLTEWASGALLALVVPAVMAQHRLGSPVLAEPGTGLGASVPGLELLLGLGLLAVALALAGAGRVSLDHGRVWTRAPLRTAGVALVLGAVLGAAALQPQLA